MPTCGQRNDDYLPNNLGLPITSASNVMEIQKALRLGKAPRVALVGSGGKTQTMFRLARELSKPVLVTTTTHLSLSQANLADQHHILRSDSDLPSVLNVIDNNGIVLLTGPEGPDERYIGVDGNILDRLLKVCDVNGWGLLIEADGSRQKPLKAPADYEPVIPTFVDTVVVVAGLIGVGKPLTEEWVHRPSIFQGLSGIVSGEPITLEGVSIVLNHPEGGLKNIPNNARAIAQLNQADNVERRSLSLKLAKKIVPPYHAAITTSMTTEEGPALAVHEKVAGVILAAGEARRFGKPKQVLEWRGLALVRRVAETAIKADLDPVIVVTGAYENEVTNALSGVRVQIVHNEAWKSGQSASLQAGVDQIPEHCGGVVFLLADQPWVTVELIRTVMDSHARGLAPIVAPLVDGDRANPVLFDRRVFTDLLEIKGDVGGRALFSRYPIEYVTWHDRNVLLDIDTQADFDQLMHS